MTSSTKWWYQEFRIGVHCILILFAILCAAWDGCFEPLPAWVGYCVMAATNVAIVYSKAALLFYKEP